MLGRRERHRRWARGGGWPVNIPIKPLAVVPAFFATGVHSDKVPRYPSPPTPSLTAPPKLALAVESS